MAEPNAFEALLRPRDTSVLDTGNRERASVLVGGAPPVVTTFADEELAKQRNQEANEQQSKQMSTHSMMAQLGSRRESQISQEQQMLAAIEQLQINNNIVRVSGELSEGEIPDQAFQQAQARLQEEVLLVQQQQQQVAQQQVANASGSSKTETFVPNSVPNYAPPPRQLGQDPRLKDFMPVRSSPVPVVTHPANISTPIPVPQLTPTLPNDYQVLHQPRLPDIPAPPNLHLPGVTSPRPASTLHSRGDYHQNILLPNSAVNMNPLLPGGQILPASVARTSDSPSRRARGGDTYDVTKEYAASFERAKDEWLQERDRLNKQFEAQTEKAKVFEKRVEQRDEEIAKRDEQIEQLKKQIDEIGAQREFDAANIQAEMHLVRFFILY